MALLDLLLPLRCVSCRADGALVCEACSAAFRPIRPPLCARCGSPTAWPVARCGECAGRRLSFRSARSAVAYEGPVRALVAGWKERGLRDLRALAADLVEAEVPRPEADALTFVPADGARAAWRGVNPAEALARELARRWAIPARPLLGRRSGGRQRGRSREARRANVRDAFALSGRPPSRVCLVDDVYTTGATVLAAAAELRRAGARSVEVVTFARTLRLGA